jgi:hypothetical protein
MELTCYEKCHAVVVQLAMHGTKCDATQFMSGNISGDSLKVFFFASQY